MFLFIEYEAERRSSFFASMVQEQTINCLNPGANGPTTEVGIYKRKQELDQESDQESKKKRKRKHALDQESVQEKRKLSFFLYGFLGRVLVFFCKFPP